MTEKSMEGDAEEYDGLAAIEAQVLTAAQRAAIQKVKEGREKRKEYEALVQKMREILDSFTDADAEGNWAGRCEG